MPLEPIEDKWSSFGWSVKTIDGHNIKELYETLSFVPLVKYKPTCIIAKIIKSKGDSSMENNYKFHHAKLSQDQHKVCINALKNIRKV